MGFFGLFKSPREKEAYDMMMRGSYLYARGMHYQAVFFCDRALELDPTLLHALFVKGSALAQAGQSGLALEVLNQVLLLDPEFVPGWMVKGLALCSLQRYDEGIACFDIVIKNGPVYRSRLKEFNAGPQAKERYADALYSRAIACFEAGNYYEAKTGYDKALDFDPKNPLARDLKQKLEKYQASQPPP